MVRYLSAREVPILSEQGETVELWEAPFFEPVAEPGPRASAADMEVLAQARGFQVGQEEGLASGRTEAEGIVSSLTALLDELAMPYQALDSVVTRELTQLSMTLAKSIVRRELSLDSSVITDIVEQAVSTLYKLDGELVVYLNPEDAGLVRELEPHSLEGKSWKVVEDPALSRGGCQVKSKTSFVDASVEKQIEEVCANLMENLEQGPDF